MRPIVLKDVVKVSSIFENLNFFCTGCDVKKKEIVAKFVLERGGKFLQS